jgi:hypothetical protein
MFHVKHSEVEQMPYITVMQWAFRLRMQIVGGMTFIHIPLGWNRKVVISFCLSTKY